LQETRTVFLNKARKLSFCSEKELEQEKLQEVFNKLEVLPSKLEVFSRQSIKNAINQCSDTKRLKELLILM